MRTITKEIGIYKFDELNNDAQWKVVYELNKFGDDFSDEYDSLEKFRYWFDIDCKINFDYGYWHNSATMKMDYSDRQLLSGKRLYAWLMNNRYEDLFLVPKRFGRRTSKILMKENDGCPLSGYYMDYVLLLPIREFLKNPSEDEDYLSLMDKCLDSFCSALQKEYDYHYSLEYAEEMSEANDYEFYEDGTIAA